MGHRGPREVDALNIVVRIDGQEINLEWALEGETCQFRCESEQERIAHVLRVAPGVWSIILDGLVFEARIEGNSVLLGGLRLETEVVDPRRWDSRRDRASGHGQQKISAPMPGKIVRVLVAEGDAVEPGQGVVVVEAMKMQNEMKAARAGRVTQVSTAAGATVSAGEVLVTIE